MKNSEQDEIAAARLRLLERLSPRQLLLLVQQTNDARALASASTLIEAAFEMLGRRARSDEPCPRCSSTEVSDAGASFRCEGCFHYFVGSP